jgi:methylphosphotriester-DNA--protein-cysteine methyltransferase
MTKITFSQAKFFTDDTLEAQSYWKAVTNSNHDYDGKFWYADYYRGKTYCRPSCGSKGNKQSARRRTSNKKATRMDSIEKQLEKHKYVYFRSIIEAAESGLSPCKRCKAANLSVVPPKAITQKTEEIIMAMIFDEKFIPTLNDVAKRLGKSKFHVHRKCKEKKFNIKQHIIKVKNQFYQSHKGEKLKKSTSTKRRVKSLNSAENPAIETPISHNAIATEDPENTVKENADENQSQSQLQMAAMLDYFSTPDWLEDSSLSSVMEYRIHPKGLELKSNQSSFTALDPSPDSTNNTLESYQDTPVQFFNKQFKPFSLQQSGFQNSFFDDPMITGEDDSSNPGVVSGKKNEGGAAIDFKMCDFIYKDDDFFNFDCESQTFSLMTE